ncbi:DUF1774-domain-containing protein [Xylariaceae sp. FL0662B]|nr:DUF1774-domain-containing protein [Xylariaceae sp. FL0662B]
MERINHINPFARRESHSKGARISYEILTTVTWLLSIVVSFYYSFKEPQDGDRVRRTIWDQNDAYYTAFRLHYIITSVYWVVLFILQGGYITLFFSSNVERVNAACSVGSYFILNNLFHFAFVMLFVRSYFAWAEVLLVINLINLSILYARHPSYGRFLHSAAVSGPLAWTFVAIFWNGAIMVPHPDTQVAHIFGNVFIWSILVYGLFYTFYYKDYSMGFNLSGLSAAIGVAQFFNKVVALQWIFAFAIMAALFVAALFVASFAAAGKDLKFTRTRETDAERAPLLHDN